MRTSQGRIGHVAVIALTAAALGVGLLGCDNNKSKPKSKTASTSSNSNRSAVNAGRLSPDELFINHSAEDSMAEIELGRLALDRSNNSQVRTFAQRMIDDHTRANEQLRPIAQQMGISLPGRINESQRDLSKMLGNLRGTEFDREYISHMVADHSAMVATLQDKAASARSAPLRAFASAQLPTVRDHLQLAQTIQQQLLSSSALLNPGTLDNAITTGSLERNTNANITTGSGNNTGNALRSATDSPTSVGNGLTNTPPANNNSNLLAQ